MAAPSPGDVRRIFEMALERPLREREFFIARACGEDRALREEVARLLGVDRELGGAGDAVVADGAGSHRRLGRYQLLRRLGEGGSSTVFLARRHDTEVAPEVAVKILRTDLPAIAEQRFALEQRILADLEHPNIARFLDGGVADGRHFVVLEKVEGSPITEHCDARCLGLAARLRLVRTVCDAVASAHRHLVVHRDLKPGNLLVTVEGTPKVLDFGIAKILDGSAEQTLPHHRALTPNYASPEQLRGESVTTASDVYSLGVVLYELLSGIRPFAEGLDRTTEPTPPSQAVARAEPVTALAAATARGLRPPALVKALAGDLDNLVLKALRVEATERYPSVEHLREDIRRHLDDEPIEARRAGLLYRGRKWLRRNRLAGAGLLLSAALLLALAGILVAHHLRVSAERDAAEAARAETQRVNSFLVSSFAGADPRGERGGHLTMREFLTAAARRLDRELGDDASARADLLHTLGTSLANLGATAEAEPLLRRALVLRPGGHPGRAATLAELSAVVRSRGLYTQARRYAQEALALQEMGTSSGSTHRASPVLARTLRHLALACLFEGAHADAERHARAALSIERRRADPIGLGEALLALATVLTDGRHFEEAGALAGEALELLDRGGRESLLAAELLQIQAIVHREEGDLEASFAAYRELTESRRRILGPRAMRYAEGLHSFAAATWRSGDHAQTRELLEEALAVYRGLEPPNELAVAQALDDLGALDAATSNLDAAEAHLEAALAIRRRLARGRPEYVQSLAALARLELARGERRLASHYLRQAVAALALAPESVDRVPWLQAKVRIADLLEQAGEDAESRRLLESALRDAEALLEPGHPFIRRLLGRLDAGTSTAR